MARKRRRLPTITRDTTLFTSGLLLTAHEAIVREGAERPTLLVLFAAMMGVPFIFAADEKRKSLNGKIAPEEANSS